MIKVQVYEDEAGHWRWRARAGNGSIIASSGESFAQYANAARAAQSLVDSFREDEVEVDRIDAGDGIAVNVTVIRAYPAGPGAQPGVDPPTSDDGEDQPGVDEGKRWVEGDPEGDPTDHRRWIGYPDNPPG